MTSLTPEQIAIVDKTRNILNGGTNTLSTLQRITTADVEVKGPSWVSRQTFHATEGDKKFLSQTVRDAIIDIGDQKERTPLDYQVEDVDVRWTGVRYGVSDDEPEPAVDEKEKYENMMREVKNELTILFFIGGGHYMNNASRYHSTTSKLAALTGGRCLSFSYRLSPQNPFPAALIDALFVYQSLLHPPTGSFHAAIPASSIVFAGDSAGSSLALSLTQVLLSHNKRANIPTHERILPLPAGVTNLSSGADISQALATWENTKYDIFTGSPTYLRDHFPSCEIWPSDPPRGHTYCDVSWLSHPLVCPCLSKSWEGAPPLWFAGGQEVLADSVRLIVQIAANQGVDVEYEEFAKMPHDFPIMEVNWPWAKTGGWEQSVRCMRDWGDACLRFGEGRGRIRGVVVGLDGREEALDVKAVSKYSLEEAERLMMGRISASKPWTGTKAAVKS